MWFNGRALAWHVTGPGFICYTGRGEGMGEKRERREDGGWRNKEKTEKGRRKDRQREEEEGPGRRHLWD